MTTFAYRQLSVATSQVAATQLHGGRTFHSRFKAQVGLSEESILNISVQSSLASLIRLSKLVVWDEASMANRFLLEALDRSLRDIMNVDLSFGGKSLILAGIFKFVLSMVENISVDSCATEKRSFLYFWAYPSSGCWI